MLLLEDDPDFDPEDLESEFFQTVSTEAVARKWVDQVVSESNPAEILRYVEIFLGLRPVQRRVSSKRKGGGVDDTCDDTHDARIYRLLAVADSIHDGCSKDYGQTPDGIMKYMRMGVEDLPKGLKPITFLKEEDFIQFLQNRKTLQFQQTDISNPLYGADLAHFDMQPPKVTDGGARSNELSATYRTAAKTLQSSGSCLSRKVLCVPVFSLLEDNKHRSSSRLCRIQLAQILDLGTRMRWVFGQHCVFQPDTQDSALKFLTAAKHICSSFFQKILVEKDYFVGFENRLQQVIATQGDDAKTAWTLMMCDANYDDAYIQGMEIDKTATGSVFRQNVDGISHHNVRLEGITSKYEVRFSEYRNDKWLSAEYSPEVLRRLTSACSLFSQLPGAWPLFERDSQREDINCNDEACRTLNLKRAGSWSQVEACKRKGRVFVTADRSAALYAFYRDVPFILVKMHDYWELDENMFQYSCHLVRGSYH